MNFSVDFLDKVRGLVSSVLRNPSNYHGCDGVKEEEGTFDPKPDTCLCPCRNIYDVDLSRDTTCTCRFVRKKRDVGGSC